MQMIASKDRCAVQKWPSEMRFAYQGAMAAIPYVVQITKTRAKGAIVRNCVFEDSSGFFAR